LDRANRSYSRDNLDPADQGNYLQDFLQVHGDSDAVPVVFFPGTPHCAGAGLIIVNLAAERRRLEDALRKNSTGLSEMLALWEGIWQYR